jgi:hypothetical protein
VRHTPASAARGNRHDAIDEFVETRLAAKTAAYPEPMLDLAAEAADAKERFKAASR